MITKAEQHTTVNSLVAAQHKNLIHIAMPGNNASHDRGLWLISYMDGTTERISASVKAAVALEEAGYNIISISTITD